MLGVAGYAAAVCEGSAMRTLSPQSRRVVQAPGLTARRLPKVGKSMLGCDKTLFYRFEQKKNIVNFYRFKFNLPKFYRTPTLWSEGAGGTVAPGARGRIMPTGHP